MRLNCFCLRGFWITCHTNAMFSLFIRFASITKQRVRKLKRSPFHRSLLSTKTTISISLHVPGNETFCTRCRRLFVSLSKCYVFDWRPHCISQSVLKNWMMTQIKQLLAFVDKGIGERMSFNFARWSCLYLTFSIEFLCLVYDPFFFYYASWLERRKQVFETFFKVAIASLTKHLTSHHVVYGNYVAIEIFIFLTLKWHTSYVCNLYSCVASFQQISGKQKGNRSFEDLVCEDSFRR